MNEWERHVAHTHTEKQGQSWCGVTIAGWHFVSIDHAAYSAPRDYVQPCPACKAAIIDALGREDSSLSAS